MIVLRIDVPGHSADVRWPDAELVLGSGPGAGVRREDAAWAAREAVLVHVGDGVMVVPASGQPPRRLSLGDSVRVGAATVTLVGLLPLAPANATPAEEAGPTAPEEPAPFRLAPEPGETVAAPDPARLPPETAPAPTSAAPVLRLADEPARAAAPASAPAPTPASPPPPAPAPVASGAAPAPGAPQVPPGRWRTLTFEDELAATLKRSPWFALSAAIHAVLFLAFLLFVPEPAIRLPQDVAYGISTRTAEEDALSGGPKDAVDRDAPPDDLTAPDLDLPEPPPPAPQDPQRPPDARRPVPAEVESLPEEDEAVAPVPLIGPSRNAFAARVSTRFARPKASATATADAVVNEDPDRALEVNRRAAARVRDALVRGGGSLGAALRGLKREDILVVRGSFDRMETVLEELGVPFVLRSPFDLADDPDDLSRHKVVFWNCGESVLPPRFRTPVIEAVRSFVQGGGYLFTTDWSLSHVVMPAFPGYLASSGGLRPLPEMIVDVRPSRQGARHRLLEGVFEDGAVSKWWLESASHDVQVLRPDDVEVLVEAPALAERPLERSPVIAATFAFGRGRVLHVMGHYYQQKGNLTGAVGTQRLPLNFVRMRLERDAASPSR